ncbi:MAG TPA: hypothetical protein DDX39_03265 [Bacteroidales bacterium]|nr:MAG: hypothetical protein A2W98_02620 [Bacteroidetes bacterium GWF2_33_38]HBF87639.1 hypothetical protein [Bacteroidales bacterium]
MKTTLSLIIALTLLSFSSIAQKAAKPFEGTITYTIGVEGELDEMTKAQMPTEMKQIIKGAKVRTEQAAAMATTVILSDSETKASTVLFDMMGQKMAIQQSKEDTEKAMAEIPEMNVEFTSETKVIAGYTCKKAIVKNETETIEVFYNDELLVDENLNSYTVFNKIKGILFEYAKSNEGITMKFAIKEVKKGKVSDSLFEIPEGYQIMTAEQFQSLLGQ